MTKLSVVDQGIVDSCRYIVDAAKDGLPKGETPELFGEIIEAHARALPNTKQFVGKSRLRMSLQELQRKWPLV